MKVLARRTAAVVLTGVMAAGMLSGCGEKKLDGTQVVATVNGTEIQMGVLSLYARQQQAQMEAMYRSFMGGNTIAIWDQVADEESGQTYGQQSVQNALEQLELMCVLKEKAADYNVEVTEDDKKAIADAAAEFMKANDEATLETLAVNEEQVKMLLELLTYQERMHDPIIADADTEVSDEEAQQSSFTYMSISTSGEDLTEEDIAKKKEQAQEILDQMKEDPAADMSEIAKGVDESFAALTGTFDANVSEDEENTTSYPDEVMEALRSLKEGEVCAEVIETENSYYIVRLDKENDEEATASKKETLKNEKENEFYSTTTEGWVGEADVKANDKVVETLVIDDNHTFSFKQVEEAEETETEEIEETESEDLTDAEEEVEEVSADETEDAAADAGDTEEDTAEDAE